VSALRCFHVETDNGATLGVAATCKRDALQMTQDRLSSEGWNDRPVRAADVGSWTAEYGTVLAYSGPTRGVDQ
jgi:hypothetical protein